MGQALSNGLQAAKEHVEMLRKILAALIVLALAVPVAATPDIDPPDSILVQLTIGEYAQVWFQDDNWGHSAPGERDLDIVFSGAEGTDYYRLTSDGLIGEYDPTTSTSGTAEDGWSMGYFESRDGATIWIQSNVDLDGYVCPQGDLEELGGGHTLPSWYTVAVTGYDHGTGMPDPNGFRLGNALGGSGWVSDGILPFASAGGYAGDGDATGNEVLLVPAGIFSFGNQGFWPDQDAFAMASACGMFDFDAPVGPGTIKFLGRVHRNGVADPAGIYTSYINIGFGVAP